MTAATWAVLAFAAASLVAAAALAWEAIRGRRRVAELVAEAARADAERIEAVRERARADAELAGARDELEIVRAERKAAAEVAEELYARLRKGNTPGAGERLDRMFQRMRAHARDRGGETGPDPGRGPDPGLPDRDP